MGWLDSAIAWASPEAAYRREQYRRALTAVRAYEASKTGRRTDGWTAGGSSANAEITPSMATLRNRARQQVRDNAYASRAMRSLVAKCVGTGIMCRTEKAARPAWNMFVRDCDLEGELDLYGLQWQVARTAFESGEALIRRYWTRDPEAPLKLQVLEPDYIDSTKFEDRGDTVIISGVEIDRKGRKKALWLFDQHPGENAIVWKRYESRRVPIEDVIPFYEKDRPGQLFGASRMGVSLMRLKDHDDWRDAVILKKRIEACFAAFVIGGGPGDPLAGSATTDSTTGKRGETLSPGLIKYLPASQDVKFSNPSSAVDEGFSKEELHAIAAGIGVTYEQMTGDLSGVNFSSIRAGEINLRELVEVWRWIHFVPMCLERVYSWFEEAYWTAGKLRTTGHAHEWTCPRWQWVDPLKDINAAKEEIRGGLVTRSEKARELGYDPDEQREEFKSEREKDKAAGLVFDTDAAVELKAKAAQPAEQDPAAPPNGSRLNEGSRAAH